MACITIPTIIRWIGEHAFNGHERLMHVSKHNQGLEFCYSLKSNQMPITLESIQMPITVKRLARMHSMDARVWCHAVPPNGCNSIWLQHRMESLPEGYHLFHYFFDHFFPSLVGKVTVLDDYLASPRCACDNRIVLDKILFHQ